MQLAAWNMKSSEHFASHARMSSARAAELHMVRGHRVPPYLRAGEAAARLEKHGESMSFTA